MDEEVSIPFGTKTLSGLVTHPSGEGKVRKAVLLTHGAGGDHNHSQLEVLSHYLANEGFLVLRFTCKGLNINYRIKAFGCVLEYFLTCYKHIEAVIVGGRSMGARAAVMLSSRSFTGNPCQESSLQKITGVICLAYPLNAKGQSVTPVRRTPLIELKVPVFFMAGTHDPLCKKTDLEEVIADMTCQVDTEWRKDCGHDLEIKNDSFESALPGLIKWCRDHSVP